MKHKTLLLAIALVQGCIEPAYYKKVIEITKEVNTYEVTVTNQIGGDYAERGAGGALIGGGLDLALGGSGAGGAIVGALVGAATTEQAKTESYKEMRTDTLYRIVWSDGTVYRSKNYCQYIVGDSLPVFK